MGAHRNTGTYLFVKEGGERPEAPSKPVAAVVPDTFPAPGVRLRVRRRAINLVANELDGRLAVWLDPQGDTSRQIYDVANGLLAELTRRGTILVAPAQATAAAGSVTLQLAAALAASARTVLVDVGAGEPFGRLLGVESGTGLGDVLAERRADPTSPIDLLGIGRGLDLLTRGDRTMRASGESVLLAGVVADLRRYAELVVLAGPCADHADFDAYTAHADAVVILGDDSDLARWQARPQGGQPVGFVVTGTSTASS
jgi:Mrp family chromosome partitioning ATPase